MTRETKITNYGTKGAMESKGERGRQRVGVYASAAYKSEALLLQGCARAHTVTCRPPIADIGFNTRSGHMGFTVDEAAVGHTFLQVLLYSLVSIILQNLDTH